MKKVACISAFLVASMLAITPVVYSGNPLLEPVIFKITLTGKESFQKLIKAGQYDSVDEELTEVNPKPAHLEKGEKKLILVKFSEDFPIEEMPARLAKSGVRLRSATMFELLSFGAQYPIVQLLDEGRPILSPDATLEIVDVYDDEKPLRKYSIYLRGVAGRRILGANYAGMFWNKNWWCLAAELPETETKKGR